MTTLARTRLELPVGVEPVRLARGIWTPDAPADLAARCARVLAALPGHCVVVGMTAAVLHDMWVEALLPGVRPEIAFTASGPCSLHTRSRRPEIRSSRRLIPSDHIVVVAGVAVTSAAWTWRDLATRVSVPALVAAGDGLLRAGVTPEELADVVDRRRGRPGTSRALTCLGLLDRRSRSRPESHLRVELVLGGPSIPPFEVNMPVVDAHGGWLAEPDLSNDELHIAVEYQGDDHAELRRMRRDITRTLDLSGRTWDIAPAGPADVFGHPDRVRAAVRRMALDKGWSAR